MKRKNIANNIASQENQRKLHASFSSKSYLGRHVCKNFPFIRLVSNTWIEHLVAEFQISQNIQPGVNKFSGSGKNHYTKHKQYLDIVCINIG